MRWGTKDDQEVVLAVRLHRWAFDEILKAAVHSAFLPEIYGDQERWKEAVAHSAVRLQWDPDHDPSGHPLERRAIQLGMRGQTLKKYASEWILNVSDISGFVRDQAQHAVKQEWSQLLTPRERVYPVSDGETAKKLELNHD